ncbi:MAG TPA: AbrB/MazE/SpoVT family DNA-binding domain-containing protein [bacterium]|nr:AbrB/MazE/SpoVT family DNA-binding domain-containing protein [bacterium]HPN44756.1 AbrB/MazE/SpoVT family DNA-binding domain-containing protein [bacterium]
MREAFIKTVTISSRFQVCIPREIVDNMTLTPGQKMQVFQYEDRIELVPVKSITARRGFLKGINPQIDRDEDRL